MRSLPASSDYADWREALAKANDPAFWPIEAIDREVDEKRAQFWCDGRAAMVTRIVLYPGGAKVIEVMAAAGDLGALKDTIEPAWADFAQAADLTHRMIAGRPGWARVFRDWRHYQTVLVKEV